MKRKYVVGFLISQNCKRVVLIRKNRPQWQAGKLNGVGGHIEDGETPIKAMMREFLEETGVRITSWHKFAQCIGAEWHMHCFCCFVNDSRIDLCNLKTTTDEDIVVFNVENGNRGQLLNTVAPLIELAILAQKNGDFKCAKLSFL